ncbi:MAG: hypothetical protein ABJD97_06570, partial [Betaproteobacteria bacterium]
GSGAHAGSAVAPTVATLAAGALSLQDAVRVSFTDMVYLAPVTAAGGRWLGGAVDLLPVELGAALADEVWIDRKDAIPRWTMSPAWREVLGVDGRRRQRQVDAAPVALRIPNQGLQRALPDSVLERSLGLSATGLQLRLHGWPRIEDYRRVVHAQFEEGRRRLRAALGAPAMIRP